ncbi:transcriptional regulator with XRE-family HTH domain [Actinomadura coerulea]|uniref:Transcriptional regulator with XRE-family HTH domain n=1 Tax=Actinomadura coerulea TaxID=46159 RepID=A0A7X0L1I2_9ACTN|nr:helix-turn-helix transcriptional regulator [Actinomadura coerulea]MBB6398565.1 transcriptional regulator with XRE-family HTH domain [Actinomadura coerulea]GGQ00935.1 DNA-binding protein [Actinomadura coerulea]
MARNSELGEFLKSRRARLRPDDTGLPSYGTRRRVPGLRREELAQLAGVSVAYYIRLEQGTADGVSTEVLDAISRALRLDGDEHAHLHRLAHPPRRAPVTAPPRLRAPLQHLLDSFTHAPAYVVGHYTNVVAWNRLTAAVFVDLANVPPDERTWSHQIHLNTDYRDRLGDNWPTVARRNVAYLRFRSGQDPGDPHLRALIDCLRERSPEFGRLWSAHHVTDLTNGEARIDHPEVGRLVLPFETLHLPGDPDLSRLMLYAAEPGSASEAALHKLAETSTHLSSADLVQYT